MTNSNTNKISSITAVHYLKLTVRSIIFISVLLLYIFKGFSLGQPELIGVSYSICAAFFIEMLSRFFPSNIESMGCQKQFKKNYIQNKKEPSASNKNESSVYITAIVWILMNAVIGVLYLTGIFDAGIMLLISLFYSICDMICILFFCPFQTWFLKNKCCVTCRIYNWDFAMMFTPLIFVINGFSLSLIIPALLLLIRWEYDFHKAPERFSENDNSSLSCANCTEKLCMHKTQLRDFQKKLYDKK